MSRKIKVFSDAQVTVGQVDPKLYGSFIEHLGRAVYEGIYEPTHPLADQNGFRTDVMGLVKELNVPIVRYPGGNFLSGYRWQDGVGEKSKRPVRLDLAWFTTEPNEFGTDEFIRWCTATGIEPLLGVNMGTGTPREAADLVEYCNYPAGTALSDWRRANGAENPYHVRYWCLGNEMDGEWQIGHLDAEDYAKKALEAAKLMRWTNGENERIEDDRSLKLIVSGSSSRGSKTFPEWDRVVLEKTYSMVDYLSMHQYYMYDRESDHPLEDFLSSADEMDGFIGTLRATIEFVRAKLRTRKKVYLSFDEWNIWTLTAPRTEPLWIRAPHILEDVYTFQDALVFAGMMNTLLNNCDIVKIGCLAQLVNVIAPIMTKKSGGTFKQTTFYPFYYISNNMRGETVRTFYQSERFEGKNVQAREINLAVNHNKANREVCVSVCNYAQESHSLELELRSFGNLVATECVEMTSSDLFAVNGFDRPEAVTPHRRELPTVKDGERAELDLPPMSWSFLKFRY